MLVPLYFWSWFINSAFLEAEYRDGQVKSVLFFLNQKFIQLKIKMNNLVFLFFLFWSTFVANSEFLRNFF